MEMNCKSFQEKHWELSSGGVTAVIQWKGGQLSLKAKGPAPGMDFQLSPLSAIAASGVRQSWDRLIQSETRGGPV